MLCYSPWYTCLFLSFFRGVAHNPAVPDTHQFEMQWMKLSLPLGGRGGLHSLTKTLLICYWFRPAVALLWSLKTEKGMSGRIVDFNCGPAAHFDIAKKYILVQPKIDLRVMWTRSQEETCTAVSLQFISEKCTLFYIWLWYKTKTKRVKVWYSFCSLQYTLYILIICMHRSAVKNLSWTDRPLDKYFTFSTTFGPLFSSNYYPFAWFYWPCIIFSTSQPHRQPFLKTIYCSFHHWAHPFQNSCHSCKDKCERREKKLFRDDRVRTQGYKKKKRKRWCHFSPTCSPGSENTFLYSCRVCNSFKINTFFSGFIFAKDRKEKVNFHECKMNLCAAQILLWYKQDLTFLHLEQTSNYFHIFLLSACPLLTPAPGHTHLVKCISCFSAVAKPMLKVM